MRPQPGLREWVGEQLGPTGPWVRLDAGRGSTAVFGLTAAEGHAYVIKQFRSVRGFAQERRALQNWFGESQAVGGARVPKLIADAPKLAALILERVPGAAPDPDAEHAIVVHRAAGRFLAALHQLELDPADPVPLAEALAQRTRAWLGRATLEPGEGRIVAELGPRPELFAGARRVACHRDFAPRNWLWDGETLAVVDFEHARPDLALVDLAKLCVGTWSRRPDCAAAFFAGYGRRLTEREREQLRALVVLHGLASLAWGHERGDLDLVLEGRRALTLARDGSLEF